MANRTILNCTVNEITIIGPNCLFVYIIDMINRTRKLIIAIIAIIIAAIFVEMAFNPAVNNNSNYINEKDRADALEDLKANIKNLNDSYNQRRILEHLVALYFYRILIFPCY